MTKTALITGITGQDGRYLAEFLHTKGYRVFGLTHRGRQPSEPLLREELPFLREVPGDLRDARSLRDAIEQANPDEIYNLGALSSVARSWSELELSAQVTALGPLRLLEAIRGLGRMDSIRFYQASSSEMYGAVVETPQHESTPFVPVHPYGTAKVFAHYTTVNVRQNHDLFGVCGILFNHESPRRPDHFVTRKISRGVARIALGLQAELTLGNLDVRRDWGYAPEYVEAMWLMLQRSEPRDYVVATGEAHTVREFAATAFELVNIDAWERFLRIDPGLFRPADVQEVRGDASRAAAELGWKPKTGFRDIVRIMVEADLERERAVGRTGVR